GAAASPRWSRDPECLRPPCIRDRPTGRSPRPEAGTRATHDAAEPDARRTDAFRRWVRGGTPRWKASRPSKRDVAVLAREVGLALVLQHLQDRKSTRLNSSHVKISYAVFCL